MSLEDPTQKITIYPSNKLTPGDNFSYTPIECSTWDIKDYYQPLSEARKIPVPQNIVKNFDALPIIDLLEEYKQDIQNHYNIKSPFNFYAIIRTSDTKETVINELNKLTNFFQDKDAARNIQEGSSVRIGNKGNVVFYYCPVFTSLRKFHIDFGVKKEQSILVPSTNMENRLQLNYVFEFERDVVKSKKDETTKIMPIRKDTEPEEVIPILEEEENPLPTDAAKIPPSVPLFQLPYEQAEQLKKSSISQFNSEHKYIEKTVEETLENIEKCEDREQGEPDGLSQVLKEEYKKIEENNQKKLKEEEERLMNEKSKSETLVEKLTRLSKTNKDKYVWQYSNNTSEYPTAYTNEVWESEKSRTLLTVINKASNDIYKSLSKHGAIRWAEENKHNDFILATPSVIMRLETLPEYAKNDKKQYSNSDNVYKVGFIGRFTVYQDNNASSNYAIVGQYAGAHRLLDVNVAPDSSDNYRYIQIHGLVYYSTSSTSYSFTVSPPTSPNVIYHVNGVPTYSGPITFTTGSTSNCVIGVSSQYTGTVDENGKVSDLEHVGDKVVPSSVEEAGKKFQKETEEMRDWERKMIGIKDVGSEDEDDNSLTGRLRKEAEKVANKEVWKEIGNDNEVPPPIEEQIKNEETRLCSLGITKKEEEQRSKENWKTVSREEFYGIPPNKGRPVSDKMNNYDTFAPVFQKDYITKERCFQAVSKVNGELPKAWKNATKGFYVREAIDASLSDETILLKKQSLLKDYAKQFGVNEIYQPSEVANMTVYKVSYIKHHILHENGIKFILSKDENGLVFYGDKPLPEKNLTRFITKSYRSLEDAIRDLSFHQKRGILVIKEISREEYAETLFPSWVPRNDFRVRFYVIEPEKVKEEPKKIKIDQETQTTWNVEKGKKPERLDSNYKSWSAMVDSIKNSTLLPGELPVDKKAHKRLNENIKLPDFTDEHHEKCDKILSQLKSLTDNSKKTEELHTDSSGQKYSFYNPAADEQVEDEDILDRQIRYGNKDEPIPEHIPGLVPADNEALNRGVENFSKPSRLVDIERNDDV
jgi:hypothetical protein